MPLAYVGLGTNLGDKRENLRKAIAELRWLCRVDAVSSVYESEPIGYTDQPDFWNAVARIETALPPDALLEGLQAAELRIGRTPSFRNGPRAIDLDLLLYDDVIVVATTVELPHPRWLERRFVIEPLLELDPRLTDPRSGTLVSAWRASAVPARLERLFDGSELVAAAGLAE